MLKASTNLQDLMPGTPVSTEQPQPGSFTLCMQCGALLCLDDKLHLAAMDRDDIRRLTQAPPAALDALMKAQQAILLRKMMKAAMN